MLAQALGKSELADVCFKVRGVWVASGHRSWLSGRSPVFARMFANETEERATGVVNLDDVSAEGLGKFLELLYMGESHFSCSEDEGILDGDVDVESIGFPRSFS